MEEGRTYKRQASLSSKNEVIKPINKKVILSNSDEVLNRAISSVRTDKRPLICFLCIGNTALPIEDQVKKYVIVRSLSRHF